LRNVLADNKYVKVYCRHCGSYNLDLNSGYRCNLTFSCQNCFKENYPHTWIEKPTIKNNEHEDGVAIYFDK